MDKQHQLPTAPYLPPRLTVVAFKVEDGFQSPQDTTTLLLPTSSSNRSTEDYSSTANSGSGFWGNNTNLGSSNNEGYGSYGWTW
jgi:hypothetical protein